MHISKENQLAYYFNKSVTSFCDVINVTKLHSTDEGFDLLASSFWIFIFAAYKSKN